MHNISSQETSFSNIIEHLCYKHDLSQALSHQMFNNILLNQISTVQMSSFLTALKIKGESESEVLGAIQSILALKNDFPNRDRLVNEHIIADCCGTGGDGKNTLNISTAVAFIASTQKIKIAKHGNRAVSSQCGASDILTSLGIDLFIFPEQAYQQLINFNLSFLHAPHYHPNVKNVNDLRRELKVRTIFNLIGPFINPIQPPYQLIGSYNPEHTQLFAKLLQKNGAKSALIVHGSGTDECAIHDKTKGHLLTNGEITDFTLTPESVGLKRYDLTTIRGQDINHNKKALLELLQGKGSDAYRAIVALNTGALFYVTAITHTIKQGVELAQSILSTDLGMQQLQKLIHTQDIKC